MLTKKLFVFILLNILGFNHAVPQKYYQGYLVGSPVIMVEDNKPSEIDRKIEALEKLTEKLIKKLEQLEGSRSCTESELTSEPPQGIKEVDSDYLINLRNVTVNLYSNDLRIVSKSKEEDSASSRTHCVLNIDKVSKLQPLMVSPSLTWPSFEVNEAGAIVIPKGEKFVLICPNQFINFSENYVTATCNGGTNVLVKGVQHEYSYIQCTEEVKHVVERTGQNCLPGNTEKVKILYNVLNRTTSFELYEICMDKRYNDAIYTKHFLHKSIADVDYSTTWSDSNQFGMNFDNAYNCTLQTASISKRLGRDFHTQDRCCFARRQLVSHRDVFPGVPQRATFSYMNVAPQWSTCNSENWNDVERRVRALAKSSAHSLHVWTGVKYDDEREIAFPDNHAQYVPIYFWKLVQDSVTQAALAIIQVNVPDLTPHNKGLYTRCTDICDEIEWMRGSSWFDWAQGYTYCCSMEEFERAFDFRDVFKPNFGVLLNRASQ